MLKVHTANEAAASSLGPSLPAAIIDVTLMKYWRKKVMMSGTDDREMNLNSDFVVVVCRRGPTER